MSSRSPFSTTNLQHATYLLAKGFPFLGANADNGRVMFVFDCSAEAARVYFTPADEVSCGRLFSAWKALRTIIDEHRAHHQPTKRIGTTHDPAHR